MASNPKKIQPQVKSLVRQYLLREEGHPINLSQIGQDERVIDAHIALVPNVIRIPRLSDPSPKVDVGYRPYIIRAVHMVLEYLKNNPKIRNRTMLFLDGLTYQDVNPMPHFYKDALAVLVYWQDYKPIIVVKTGLRQWIKNSIYYHLENSSNGYYHVNQYSLGDTLAGIMAKYSETEGVAFPDQIRKFSEKIDAVGQYLTDPRVQYPIAAANVIGEMVFYVPRPYRHHQILMSSEYQRARMLVKMANQNSDEIVSEKEHQGFITNHGHFVTRYRAMLMAIEHDQIVGSENIVTRVTSSLEKQFHPDEAKFHGFLRDDDANVEGFLVCQTPLFSEDMF